MQLIVQILDTLRFWAPFGGLGTTYDVHLGLIGKRVVDFLLMLIELFSLDVTVEALPTRSIWPKISGRKGCPTNHFAVCTDSLGEWMSYKFVADSFAQRNFVADFLQTKCDYTS